MLNLHKLSSDFTTQLLYLLSEICSSLLNYTDVVFQQYYSQLRSQ